MQTILVSVGTSLLGNAARELKKAAVSDEEIAAYLAHGDPARVSAETNTLARLDLSEGELVFLHSDTDEGRRCAGLLARYYSNRGCKSRERALKGLDYRPKSFVNEGLRSLVAVLAEEIREARKLGRQPKINATGGFKAETAYATLVGALFQVPVFYIHEKFDGLVEVPALPVAWDFGLIAEHVDLLEWLFTAPRTEPDVDGWMRGRPIALRALIAAEQAGYGLSPVGLAVYERFLDRIEEEKAQGTPIELSEAARDALARADSNDRRSFERILEALRLPEVRRGNVETVDRDKGDVVVYPRTRTNHRVFVELSGESVRVLELVRHNDGSYDQCYARGVFARNYQGFSLWES